jgi:hypothetical protein
VSAEEVLRSEERRVADLKGFVRLPDGTIAPAEFENVSPSGCCLRGDYRIGEILIATIPSIGTVEAQVRWSIGGRSGLRFQSKPVKRATA